MDQRIEQATRKMARRFRFVGWWFLVIGLLVCIQPVAVLFDAQASIAVNGVPRSDLPTKLAVAAFAVWFPLFGLFLAFTPQERMIRWLASFLRWVARFVTGSK